MTKRFWLLILAALMFAVACDASTEQAIQDAAEQVEQVVEDNADVINETVEQVGEAVEEAMTDDSEEGEAMTESSLPSLGGREVTVAVENAYLPFNYIDLETGEAAGWDYDVINRLGELLDFTPVYVTAPWEGMIQAVADGEFDMAADGITITEDRAQIVDFSMGYINIDQRLLVRQGEDRFDGADAFVADESLIMGTQSGTTNFETASELLPLERIQAFDQFGFAVEALINGDVDAVILDETAGQGYLGVNADELELVGESLSGDQLGFIYPKGSELVAAIDAGLQEMMSNGELAAINTQYFSDAFTVTYDDIGDPSATAEMSEDEMMEDLPDLGGREVTVAVENAYLPFNYIDLETGEAAGWDYDVINLLGEMLNFTPVYVTAPWEGMIQAVADGEFDMAADGITITEDRAQIVDFSMGYINIDQRLLVRQGEDRFDGADAFVADESLIMGTQSGTTNFETASELLPLERIQAFDQFGFAVEALINGDVDAVILDETAGQGYLGVNADELELVGESLSGDQLGFIYPKGSELVAAIDAGLQAIMKDGQLAAINTEYFSDAFTVTYDDIGDPSASEEEAMAEMRPISICEVTDVGGIDDASFNATAWVGAQAAAEVTGGEAQFLESVQQTDYDRNIAAFVDEGCDLVVGVGFLLGDAIAAASEQYPDNNFTIIDFAYDPPLPNVIGQVYASNQAAFLAGMVAADTTETGIVGVYGGINIPPVTDFMDGFVLGVDYYNNENGTDVQVLGWDIEAQDGLFIGNFDSTDDGRTTAESLMDEGADVIFPLAGAAGIGSGAAILERGSAWMIGADTDWRVSAPEFADITLVSTLKRMDISLVDVAKLVATDTFEGGVYLGTLENGGVGITDGAYDIDLTAVIEMIIAGEIQTTP